MELNDTFSFGQYKNLTLQQVFQGTLNIDRQLIKSYLIYCIESDTNVDKPAIFEFIDDFIISEDKIIIRPTFFDGDKPIGPNNIVHIGNIELFFEGYFDTFFNPNWLGIIKTIEKFNSESQNAILGGNPEYIKWCISEKVENFVISDDVVKRLENLKVHRFKGISISYIGDNIYEYAPKIIVENFQFSANI